MNPFPLQLHTSYPQPPDCAWISDCKFLSKKFRRDFLIMSLRHIILFCWTQCVKNVLWWYSGAAEWFVLKKNFSCKKFKMWMFWSWPCVSWLHTDTFIRQSPWERSSGLLQSHCSHPYTTTFLPCNIVIILSHLLLTKQNPGIYPYLYPYQHITFWWRVPIEKVQAICWKKYTSSQIVLSRASVPGARNNKFVTET